MIIGKRQNEPRGSGQARSQDVDAEIVAYLRKDGRASSREIACALGVNEATVRVRIKRMEESELLRVLAMVDLEAAGFEHVLAAGIRVKTRLPEDVGRDMAKMEQIVTVCTALGDHDLEIQVIAKDKQEIFHLLTDIIPSIPGVSKVTPGLIIRFLKYESPWIPFQ